MQFFDILLKPKLITRRMLACLLGSLESVCVTCPTSSLMWYSISQSINPQSSRPAWPPSYCQTLSYVSRRAEAKWHSLSSRSSCRTTPASSSSSSSHAQPNGSLSQSTWQHGLLYRWACRRGAFCSRCVCAGSSPGSSSVTRLGDCLILAWLPASLVERPARCSYL